MSAYCCLQQSSTQGGRRMNKMHNIPVLIEVTFWGKQAISKQVYKHITQFQVNAKKKLNRTRG